MPSPVLDSVRDGCASLPAPDVQDCDLHCLSAAQDGQDATPAGLERVDPETLAVIDQLFPKPTGGVAFALGYWAGCRVSDVSWLLMDHLHVNAKAGSMIVGHKGGKLREIDLTNEARRRLLDYLNDGERKASAYVFTSQRAKKRLSRGEIDGWRWSEDGIHVWWQGIKERARKAEAELIGEVTFHDFRHDFAHRARESGWSLEEVAYYLGHMTKSGTPAIQTTVRYTQVRKEQVKQKLKDLKG